MRSVASLKELQSAGKSPLVEADLALLEALKEQIMEVVGQMLLGNPSAAKAQLELCVQGLDLTAAVDQAAFKNVHACVKSLSKLLLLKQHS